MKSNETSMKRRFQYTFRSLFLKLLKDQLVSQSCSFCFKERMSRGFTQSRKDEDEAMTEVFTQTTITVKRRRRRLKSCFSSLNEKEYEERTYEGREQTQSRRYRTQTEQNLSPSYDRSSLFQETII